MLGVVVPAPCECGPHALPEQLQHLGRHARRVGQGRCVPWGSAPWELSAVLYSGVLQSCPLPRRLHPIPGRRWAARTGTARCWSRPMLPGRCAPCPREGGFSHHASRRLFKDAPAAPPCAHFRRSSIPPSPFLVAGAPPGFLPETPRSEFAGCEDQECSRVRDTDRKPLGFCFCFATRIKRFV